MINGLTYWGLSNIVAVVCSHIFRPVFCYCIAKRKTQETLSLSNRTRALWEGLYLFHKLLDASFKKQKGKYPALARRDPQTAR